MKVIAVFDFSDEQRSDITAYQRHRFGKTGLPKLATRQQCRDFILEAMSNHWTGMADDGIEDEIGGKE